MNSLIPLDDRLTIEERACVLRPARARIKRLQAELYRLHKLPIRHAAGPIEAAQSELDCTASAVTKLWRQPTRPP